MTLRAFGQFKAESTHLLKLMPRPHGAASLIGARRIWGHQLSARWYVRRSPVIFRFDSSAIAG